MTTILTQYPCWPNTHLLESPEHVLAMRADHLALNHSSSPISSASQTTRSVEADTALPSDFAPPLMLSNEQYVTFLLFPPPLADAQGLQEL